MPLIVAKTICRLYAVGLAVLAVSFAAFLSGSIVTAGLLATAVGLALLHRWAFLPAFAVPILYIAELVARAIPIRLRPSSVMPRGVATRFPFNWLTELLLERPARFFAWYGVPPTVTAILFCAFLIAALAYAYRVLKRNGQLGAMSPKDKTSYIRIISALSKVSVAVGVLIIAIAVWRDPPTGGTNPGGPAAGSTLIFAALDACPWFIIGGIGWVATSWFSRRAAPPAL
jgi:hypothetical protein